MGAKILVIDDDKEIREFLDLIMKDTQWYVTFCDNAVKGLRLAQEDKPDLIILDIYMPGLDGIKMLKMLRRNPKTSNIPVLILTSAKEDEFKEHVWLQGADSFMNKPVNIKAFYKAIEDLLSPRYKVIPSLNRAAAYFDFPN